MKNYEAALAHSLERSANMLPSQIDCIVAKYRTDAARTQNLEKTFDSYVESFSNETSAQALSLFEHLQKIESENKLTIPSSLERAQKHAKKLTDNYNTLECEIVLSDEEKKYMPEHQRNAFERAEQERLAGPVAQTAIPSCFFQSQATWRDRRVPITLEIIQR